MSRSVLLAALHPEPDAFRRLPGAGGGDLEWDWLLERATAHKVGALLADRVAMVAGEMPLPDHVRARLDGFRALAIERNAQALRDLERVDGCLRHAGIDYVLLKGPVLTQQVYDGPRQRHFFDLDLLVREADVDPAQTALAELGYVLWGGDRYLGFAPTAAEDLARATRAMRGSLKRFSHELAFVTADRALLPIDLHWHLLPPGRIRGRPALFWERQTTAVVGGIEVRVLDPEATLLHLAMHAWSNRPWSFTLLHLCDVAWALSRLRVDARRLVELAERCGGSGDLGRSLYAVEHVLGVPPPAAIRAAGPLQPSPRFRRLATQDNLLDRRAVAAPAGWAARLREEIEWARSVGSLPSTGILLLAKYSALLRYRAGW